MYVCHAIHCPYIEVCKNLPVHHPLVQKEAITHMKAYFHCSLGRNPTIADIRRRQSVQESERLRRLREQRSRDVYTLRLFVEQMRRIDNMAPRVTQQQAPNPRPNPRLTPGLALKLRLFGEENEQFTEHKNEQRSEHKIERSTEFKETKATCCICQEVITTHTVVRTLPCYHVFCKVCIDRWLDDNEKCPTCRQIAEPCSQNRSNRSSHVDERLELTLDLIQTLQGM